jgi:tetratricopeptide (TPR) repeat protein
MLTHKTIAQTFALALMGLLLFLPFPPDLAQAQEDCRAKLTQAENAYTNGRFDEAIDLLSECVNKDKLSRADEQRALKLLGLAFLGKDYVDQAKNTIRKLLELVPGYEPDPDQDPPIFTNMVKQMKEETRRKEPEKKPLEPTPKKAEVKKKGGAKWLLIGGLVVAAGGGAALALGGGGGGGTTPPPPTSQSLPTPPPLP